AVPNEPMAALAAAAMGASAGIALMSGPSEETNAPLIVNVPGREMPSGPKMSAFLGCSAGLRPNCWAFAGTCQGSTTTVVVGVTLLTSDEKSVDFWLTDSWSTVTPAALKTGIIAVTSPVE